MSFSDLAVFVMIVAGLAGFGATVKWLYSPRTGSQAVAQEGSRWIFQIVASIGSEQADCDPRLRWPPFPPSKPGCWTKPRSTTGLRGGYLPMRRTSAAFTRDEQ